MIDLNQTNYNGCFERAGIYNIDNIKTIARVEIYNNNIKYLLNNRKITKSYFKECVDIIKFWNLILDFTDNFYSRKMCSCQFSKDSIVLNDSYNKLITNQFNDTLRYITNSNPLYHLNDLLLTSNILTYRKIL